METKTQEEILKLINSGKDSVVAIQQVLDALTKGTMPTIDLKYTIERNVKHLQLVVSDKDVVNSGENISDLQQAITISESKLAENIWPAEDPNSLQSIINSRTIITKDTLV